MSFNVSGVHSFYTRMSKEENLQRDSLISGVRSGEILLFLLQGGPKVQEHSILFTVNHVLLIGVTKLSQKLLKVLIKMFSASIVICNNKLQMTMPLVINSINN